MGHTEVFDILTLVALVAAIAAIRRVLELQKTVLKLQAKMENLYRQSGAVFEPGPDEQVYALARSGKTIEAIKRYRDLTGQGLKESKDAIDAIARGDDAPKR